MLQKWSYSCLQNDKYQVKSFWDLVEHNPIPENVELDLEVKKVDPFFKTLSKIEEKDYKKYKSNLENSKIKKMPF